MSRERRPTAQTMPICMDWRPEYPVGHPEPRRRAPRDAASLAETAPLPVIR